MLFDSHAHLHDEKFDADREQVIKRALENNVTGILTVGTCMTTSARAVALAEQYEGIYAAVGIHPHDAQGITEADYAQLATWSEHDKVVAIGEIGLDYYYDLAPKDTQRAVLVRQIHLAREMNKPFIIHDRDAHRDIMDVIKSEAQGLSGVFHCFSGSLEMAKEVIKLGFYISIAGPVTFKNAAKLPEIVASIPLERLLVETDCPYLTPHPFRGKRNEPAYVSIVAEKIASLRGIERSALAESTTANVKRLFKIK